MGAFLTVTAIAVICIVALKYLLPKEYEMRRNSLVGIRETRDWIPDVPFPDESVTVPKPPPLPEGNDERLDWFWRIIEFSRQEDDSQERQVAALRTQLWQLEEHEVAEFSATLERLLVITNSWDLWGAAYVICGGCSDDDFAYFRVWMVSRGRAFFEAAIADPDQMASLISRDYAGYPSFELFAYVSAEVWEAKTGGEMSEMPGYPSMFSSSHPQGDAFEEDEVALSRRYPRLSARFLASPLG